MVRKIILPFVNAINEVSNLFFILSKVALGMMVLTIFYNVFMRYVFNHSAFWCEEVNNYMLIFMAFMGAAEIMRRGGHIRFDLFSNRLTGKRAVSADLFILCTALFWCALVTWKSLAMWIYAYQSHMCESSLLQTPRVIPYSFLLVGLIFLGLQFLILLGKDVSSLLLSKEKT